MAKLRLKLKDLKLGIEKDLDVASKLHESAITELSKASITPTTLASKTFWAQDDKDEMPLKSQEEYVYGANRVIKFGINPSHIHVDPIADTAVITGELQKVGLPMGSMNSAQYPRSKAKEARLSILEKNILTEAIEHLRQNPANPIVLVDIFERSNGTTISLDKGLSKQGIKQLAIHTVLLYKMPSFAAVIDPSNFLFSGHLCNDNFNTELLVRGSPTISTMLTHRIQIYKEQDSAVSTGSAHNKYRDCTDIAIKLAIGFQIKPLNIFKDENDFKDEKNIANITQHPAVIQISNTTAIDKNILELKMPARVMALLTK